MDQKKRIAAFIFLPIFMISLMFRAPSLLAEADTMYDTTLQEEDVEISPYASLKNIPKRYLSDAWYILKSPARIDKSDIIPLAVVIGGTACLMAADRSIQGFLRKDIQDEDAADALGEIKFLGDGVWEGAICGGFYVGGLMMRNEKWKEIAIAGGESLLIAGGISQAIKNLSGRYRPSAGEGSSKWRGPTTESSISFPSGHATMAFALASVVATVYDENIFIGIASYGTASVVAFERMYSDSHWASDVFLGAAIGTFVGRSLVTRNRNNKGSLAVVPVYDPDDDMLGVAMGKKF
ncbi:MAG: phosphatase PAP2 family protein [Candidatus Omnitrophota bacterium]